MSGWMVAAVAALLAIVLWEALGVGHVHWRRERVDTRDACADRAAIDMPVWRTAVRTLSHDLRAPAAAILALVELQQATALPVASFTRQVADHAREGLALTDELLCLLRESEHDYRMEPLDLTGLLAGYAMVPLTASAERGDNMATVTPDRDGIMVIADARMLGEAIALLHRRASGGGVPAAEAAITLTVDRGVAELSIRGAPASAGGGAAAMASVANAFAPGPLFIERVLARHGGQMFRLDPDARFRADVETCGGWQVRLPTCAVKAGSIAGAD